MIAQNVKRESSLLIINGKPATPTELKRIVGSTVKPIYFDPEYEQWKREMGLNRPMSAQEIENVARYELAYLDK